MRNLYLILMLTLPLGYAAESIADLEARLENKDQAEAVIKTLQANPKPESPEWNMLLARACMMTNNHKEGIPVARKALELNADSPQAHYVLAMNLSNKMQASPMTWMTGKKEYLNLMKRAIELDVNYLDPYYGIIGFHSQAPSFIGASKKTAMEWAQKMSAVDPVSGGMQVANVYKAQGKEDKQLETLQKLAADHGDNPRVTYNLGLLLVEAKRYDDALPLFDGKPDHLPSRYQSGKVRVLQGKELEQAIKLLDQYAAEVQPGTAVDASAALWRKGMALEQLKRVDEARTAYEQAVAANPDFKAAKKSLAKLK